MPRHFLAILFAVCALSFWSWPTQVRAQSADPSAASAATPSDADAEARRLFELGREAYGGARYTDALAAFRRAYELSARPALLYNIGQTADRLRQDREALEAFEGYLAGVPDAANRLDVEARMQVLRTTIARDEELTRQANRAPAPSAGGSVIEEWWFWGLIGVAVVGAGVGVGFVVLSRDELAPATPGDIGPGGVVIALEVP